MQHSGESVQVVVSKTVQIAMGARNKSNEGKGEEHQNNIKIKSDKSINIKGKMQLLLNVCSLNKSQALLLPVDRMLFAMDRREQPNLGKPSCS